MNDRRPAKCGCLGLPLDVPRVYSRPVVRASVCCLLSLQLMSLPTPAYAQAAGGPAIPASAGPTANAETDASQRAKALYAARRYIEAARAYEAIDTPAALYNAGMARQAGGHTAHAIRDWQRYLESAAEVSAEERAELLQDIADAQATAVAVRFTADATPASRTLILHAAAHARGDDLKVPWPAGQVTLSVHLDAGEWTAAVTGDTGDSAATPVQVRSGEPLEISLIAAPSAAAPAAAPVRVRVGPEAAVGRGVEVAWSGPGKTPEAKQIIKNTAASWDLSPGTWTLKASARGFEPTERAVTVSGAPVDVDLTLRRDLQAQARLGLSIAFGVAAVGLVAGGAGLFVAGKRDGGEEEGLDGVLDDKSVAYSQRTLDDIQRMSAGVVMMSAAGGAGIVAITVGAGGRDKALGVEAGLGAILLAVGLPLFVVRQGCAGEIHAGQGDPGEADAADVAACVPAEQTAAAVYGLGLGMLSSAAIALITRRILRKRSTKTVSTGTIPGGFSLAVQGQF